MRDGTGSVLRGVLVFAVTIAAIGALLLQASTPEPTRVVAAPLAGDAGDNADGDTDNADGDTDNADGDTDNADQDNANGDNDAGDNEGGDEDNADDGDGDDEEVVVVVTTTEVAPAPPPPPPPPVVVAPPLGGPGQCQYVLGFQDLWNALNGRPGACLENEHPDPAGTGDQIQATAFPPPNGLMVWDRDTNTMRWTDGYKTWTYSKCLLQERLNTQTWAWEANPSLMMQPGEAPPPGACQLVAGEPPTVAESPNSSLDSSP